MKFFPDKTFRSLSFLVFFAFVVLFVNSCAKQSLISSWRSDSQPAIKVENVVVIGLARGIRAREIFENAFVDALQAENVEAYRSYEIKGKLLEQTKEVLLEVIDQTDAKTVLITHIADGKTQITRQGGAAQWVGPGDMFGGFAMQRAPRSTYTRTTVYLEALLYDVKSENLLWSAMVKLKDQNVTNKNMRKITALFMEGLKKEGLL